MQSIVNSRLALGTAQFGLPYGIANRTGQVGRDAAAATLALGLAAGCDSLDTAIAYGDSERLLGEIGVTQWRVTSKLPALPDACVDVDTWVSESFAGSLQRLGVSRLYGLLLHHPQDLLGPRGPSLYRVLQRLKETGQVGRIGVSIYDPAQLDVLCPRFPLELVQAPFSVVDRRFGLSGWPERLRAAGSEIQVRSIFLQGLLLMPQRSRPAGFNRWQALWDHWQGWLEEQSLTPLQACLGFALAQSWIDRIVVGVDSVQQLQQILASADGRTIVPPDNLASHDLDLVNPSRWSSV